MVLPWGLRLCLPRLQRIGITFSLLNTLGPDGTISDGNRDETGETGAEHSQEYPYGLPWGYPPE